LEIAAIVRIGKMESAANPMLRLFVYGSLVDATHRAEVLGHPAEGIPAILHGFERSRSRHWYLRRRDGAETAGLVLVDLVAGDFTILDRYEEVPALYTREQIEVAGQGGASIRCWVYLPTEWVPQLAE
jgi:cation transport regulator ChaC